MSTPAENSMLLFVGFAFAAMGLIAVMAGLAALLRARPLRFVLRTVVGALLLSIGALALAVAIGAQGYRALVDEQPAGRIVLHQVAPQRFTARVIFPEGREASFDIAGDEVYVDAHIIKWHTLGTLLGLRTVYELDRIGGRYRSIEQERGAPRSVHALSPSRGVDLFELRQRHFFLSPLFDAEYGSASFVPVTGDADLLLRVSPSGLLLRPR